ncbi:hypothetical protein M0813_00016 [Anaeramoeba flamelloides]|uniref:Uncharacterized protein n=1 Tax=Anaeramoeba flamelloides TaxID=1746091 RepID=A0ABQ8YW82_9EUKA|nr:hypothetical protein M0813_00016 [Anaeramoeba flamelloides]
MQPKFKNMLNSWKTTENKNEILNITEVLKNVQNVDETRQIENPIYNEIKSPDNIKKIIFDKNTEKIQILKNKTQLLKNLNKQNIFSKLSKEKSKKNYDSNFQKEFTKFEKNDKFDSSDLAFYPRQSKIRAKKKLSNNYSQFSSNLENREINYLEFLEITNPENSANTPPPISKNAKIETKQEIQPKKKKRKILIFKKKKKYLKKDKIETKKLTVQYTDIINAIFIKSKTIQIFYSHLIQKISFNSDKIENINLFKIPTEYNLFFGDNKDNSLIFEYLLKLQNFGIVFVKMLYHKKKTKIENLNSSIGIKASYYCSDVFSISLIV